MDDEALACGGLIAKMPDKDRIHIIYATDGRKSPAPVFSNRDVISPDLGKVRMQESTRAMTLLGVPEQNLHFLCLPEAQLQKNLSSLRDLLRESIHSTAPDHIFIPFRYDRHPDHLAINDIVMSEHKQGKLSAKLIEYFVYYRWRLMPKRDIRKYIKPPYVMKLDIHDVADKKRRALACFTSQTTIFYPWQTRPILTSTLLDEECRNPEYFLIADVSNAGTAIFSGAVFWIRLVHRVEPFLQRWKYLASTFLKRMFQSRVHLSE
jgi:LmbE family N-acetylglucosaminyl deacetylase